MNINKVLGATALGIVVTAGPASAGVPACAVADVSGSVATSRTFERRVSDPSTGATIVLRRDEEGVVSIEMTDRRVSIRKVLTPSTSVLTMAAAGEQVVVALNGENVAVTAGGKTWHGSARETEKLDEAADRVRQSPAAVDAKDLLDRSRLQPDSFEGNALLLTRALLGSLWGDSTGTQQYQRWVAAKAAQPKVVHAMANEGPGACWDSYASEAIRIANDYIDCGGTCHWRGYLCIASCGFLYDLRAEGAFMWYTRCSGGFFVG